MSSKNTPSLFQQAMQGVTPIKNDKVDLSRSRKKPNINLAAKRLAAVAANPADTSYLGVSDYFVENLGAEDELIYRLPDLPKRRLLNLQKGLIAWQEGLDLHGLLVEEAKQALVKFINQAYQEKLGCVLVVHGKAAQKKDASPSIKAHTGIWLQQLPQVLAFCSALPKDGGRGAVYVLLRKPKPSKDAAN